MKDKRMIIAFVVGALFICGWQGQAQGADDEQVVGERQITSDSFYKTQEYKDYAASIRSKIEKNMYKQYKVLEQGTVYLNFELSSQGKLISFSIDQEKTKASPTLTKTVVRAMKKASPFKPFPESLAQQYSTLPFKIELEFRIES